MSEANALMELLQAVALGRISPDQAAGRLAVDPAPHHARIDFDREERCGFPEVVLADHENTLYALLATLYPRHATVLAQLAYAATVLKLASVLGATVLLGLVTTRWLRLRVPAG